MQVTPTQNVNSTNFKAANLVKVKKAAFQNPENLKACSKLFYKEMNKVSGDAGGIIGNLLGMVGLMKHKTFVEPANMGYVMTQNAMKENNIPYSVSWFAQKTGLPIKLEENSDHLSFYVLTKDNKDKALSLVKKLFTLVRAASKEAGEIFPLTHENVEGKSLKEVIKEILPLRNTYTKAKGGLIADELNIEAIGDTPIRTFEISSLDEISKIAKDFDI